MAISAAISASGLIALYTVMSCSPEMIRWIAASSASWPVAKGMVVKPALFIAAMAPPAVPSLAAYTPMMLSLPSAVIACSISRCAWSGDQSGVSYSLPMFTLPSSTEWAPALKSAALGSVGDPLIMTIWPRFGSPPSLSASSSACPCTRRPCGCRRRRSSRPAGGEAVVRHHRDVPGLGVVDDAFGGLGVHRVEDEHPDALGEHRLGLRLLLGLILVGVLVQHLAVRAQLLELRLDERPVERLVPRGLRLGEQQADLEALLDADAAAVGAGTLALACTAGRDGEQQGGAPDRHQSASHSDPHPVPPGYRAGVPHPASDVPQ